MRILISCVLAVMAGFSLNAAVAGGPVRSIEWTVEMNGASKTVQIIMLKTGTASKFYTEDLKRAFRQMQGKTKVISSFYLEESDTGSGPHYLSPFFNQLADALGTMEVFAPPAADQKWALDWMKRAIEMSSKEVSQLNFNRLRRTWEREERRGEYSLDGLERSIGQKKKLAEESLAKFSSKWRIPASPIWKDWVRDFEMGYLILSSSMAAIQPSDPNKALPVDLFYASAMSQRPTPEMNGAFRGFAMFCFKHYLWGGQFDLLSEVLTSIENQDRLILILDDHKEGEEFALSKLLRETLSKVGELKQVSYSGNPISPRELRLLLTGTYSAGCAGCARKGLVKRDMGMKVCKRCWQARYCSEECHNNDWPQKHENECRKKKPQLGQSPAQSGSPDSGNKKKRRKAKLVPLPSF